MISSWRIFSSGVGREIMDAIKIPLARCHKKSLARIPIICRVGMYRRYSIFSSIHQHQKIILCVPRAAK